MRKRLEFDIVRRLDGTSEFDDFLDSLPSKDRAKMLAIISKTEEHGLEIAKKMKWVKKLRDGISELRSKQGSDIQRVMYFQEVGTKYVITHGFTKKTDKTPEKEIEHAITQMKRYLEKRES